MPRPSNGAAGLVLLLCHLAPGFEQPSLEITSPVDGTVVHPGQTLSVTVKTAKPYAMVELAVNGGFGFLQPLRTAPYMFSIEIPKDVKAGVYSFTAVGSPGSPESDESAPITIDIEYVWRRSSDASHLVQDAPGVEVETGGFPLMHRSAIPYPRDALSQGIEGTVVVEITPDSSGRVASARVLSGPAELRKDVVKSVLLWHFAKEGRLQAAQGDGNLQRVSCDSLRTRYRSLRPETDRGAEHQVRFLDRGGRPGCSSDRKNRDNRAFGGRSGRTSEDASQRWTAGVA
jgi:TonB family protein